MQYIANINFCAKGVVLVSVKSREVILM